MWKILRGLFKFIVGLLTFIVLAALPFAYGFFMDQVGKGKHPILFTDEQLSAIYSTNPGTLRMLIYVLASWIVFGIILLVIYRIASWKAEKEKMEEEAERQKRAEMRKRFERRKRPEKQK